MKKIFLLFTIVFMGVQIVAQNLPDVYHDGTKVNSGDIFDVTLGRIGWHQIDMEVTNNTSAALVLKAKRTPISELPTGSVNYFCFDNCYTPEINVSPEVTILSGGRILFTGDYEEVESGNNIVTIRYDIFNANDENAVIYFTVNYIESSYSSVGNSSFDGSIYFSQNGKNAQISYQFGSYGEKELVIFNLIGTQVYNTLLTNQSGIIELPRLGKGIYVYALKESGKILKTSKFVIQ